MREAVSSTSSLQRRPGPWPNWNDEHNSRHANGESGAMRKLEVRLGWGDEQVVVGILAEQDRRVYFEYDSAFLATPFPSPPSSYL
jgi:hypothetical protein